MRLLTFTQFIDTNQKNRFQTFKTLDKKGFVCCMFFNFVIKGKQFKILLYIFLSPPIFIVEQLAAPYLF